MKKLLMSSVVLTLFSLSILIFQISCKKEATAQTTSVSVVQKNIILYSKSSGSTIKFYTSNYDGTNSNLIPISLPSGQIINGLSGKLSPDCNKLFFKASNSSQDILYSVNMDGTGLTIVSSSTTESHFMLGAY